MTQALFTVAVEGVGTFQFRRRTMRDELRILAAQERLMEGLDLVSTIFQQTTRAFASLEILTVQAPDGWDLMALDPLDPDTFDVIGRVWRGLRDAEVRFRDERRGQSPGAGAGAGGVAGVSVPSALSAGGE